MRKLFFLAVLVVMMLTIASPAFAQGTGAAPAESARAWAVPLGACIGVGIAAGIAALGQGKVGSAVAEGIARNPGARAGIQTTLFIGLAFIESLVLFAWVMILIVVLSK